MISLNHLKNFYNKPFFLSIPTLKNSYKNIFLGMFSHFKKLYLIFILNPNKPSSFQDRILNEYAQKILQKVLLQISSNERVVVYSYWCDDTALACAMENRDNNNVSAVTRIHGWDLYFERSSIRYLPFRHFIAENMNKIVSISDSEDLINFFGIIFLNI